MIVEEVIKKIIADTIGSEFRKYYGVKSPYGDVINADIADEVYDAIWEYIKDYD